MKGEQGPASPVPRWANLLLAVLALGLATYQAASCDEDSHGQPVVELVEAPEVRLPGAPDEVDSNSPVIRVDGRLHVFTSSMNPFHSVGDTLEGLGEREAVRWELPGDARPGGRWIEAVWRDEAAGLLYGWYHLEPHDLGTLPYTAPIIGAAISEDGGSTWRDQGFVLESPYPFDTSYENGWFNGGNGDFHVIVDPRDECLYFLYTHYAGPVEAQGVCLAWGWLHDRGQPGTVFKFHYGDWYQPGIGGFASPVLRVTRSWGNHDPDAWWGPSVHWNSALQRYVLLLNRSVGHGWRQDGTYVAFSDNLIDWTSPQRMVEGGPWYPQIIGESDTRAGYEARLFLRGISRHMIRFSLSP
ncbi:MAG: hypothetical protein HY722_14225 [Planctomycetes bacterium]|nr:hypothetical protein [Planctomycetota bacterium]